MNQSNQNPKSGERATYTFEELIERLSNCETKEEVALYKSVAYDERHQYSIFHNKLIIHALLLMDEYIKQ